MKKNSKGSVLSVVMMSAFFVAAITASVLSLINTQRRIGLQKELNLQANNVAETALDYAYSYVINDINRNGLAGAVNVPASGHRTFTFDTQPRDFLLGDVQMQGQISRPSSIVFSNLELSVIAPGTVRSFFVDASDVSNLHDSSRNQFVWERTVPIVAKVTANQGGLDHTSYVQKSVSLRQVPLFQHSIFFQGQLHMHRGFRPIGGVHANGNLFLNAHNGDTALYNGAVTTASNFYRGSTFDQGGSGMDAYGYTPVKSDGRVDLASNTRSRTGLNGQIKIYKEGDGSAPEHYESLANLDSETPNWASEATRLFKGNLEDKSHQTPTLIPTGSAGYTQDVSSTASVNEFNNGPYSLIEPTLPSTHPAFKTDIGNNLQAKACLHFIIEYIDNPALFRDTLRLQTGNALASIAPIPAAGTPINLTNYNGTSNLRIVNPTATFVVRAYRVKSTWNPSASNAANRDIHDFLEPIQLPLNVIGAANPNLTQVLNSGFFEQYFVRLFQGSPNIFPAGHINVPLLNTTQRNTLNSRTNNLVRVQVDGGLFNSRLGRGVNLLTIDIARLKYVLETPIANLTDPRDIQFRQEFDPTGTIGNNIPRWNGLIYVKFPTSLNLANTATLPVGAMNGVYGSAGYHARSINGYALDPAVPSRSFTTGNSELRHPDRSGPTDTAGRQNRQDKIVPIAPELRDYPASNADLNSTILDERYATVGLQIINGRQLPNPKGNLEGFSIATNAPVYLVGNYNSDGNPLTGTNITSNSPAAFADRDPGIDEIPAAIFCDTFTVLSNGWGEGDDRTGLPHVAGGVNYVRSNRQNSFYGRMDAQGAGTNGSDINRRGSTNSTLGNILNAPGRVARTRQAFTIDYNGGTAGGTASIPQSQTYVEISACIATGEFPIFEFFTHALECFYDDYSTLSTTRANPIIFKGSLVGMFHSEIQHIKQAYNRNINNDIQKYPSQHGYYAIAASRYHTLLRNGFFPPGTPMANVTEQRGFRILRPGDPDDDAIINAAGF